MKKIILCITLMLIMLLLSICLSAYNAKKECLNANSSKDLFSCSTIKKLSPQEDYDNYYYKSSKYQDHLFILGFDMAYRRCDVLFTCNLRDKDMLFKTIKKCAYTYDKNCVSYYLENRHSHSNENIDDRETKINIFINSIVNNEKKKIIIVFMIFIKH